ncbi:MAG TPA: hypothetical protein VH796_10500 [Nitrososphaeraceae archaeon]|jgi:hypothetical protein
MSLSQIQYAFSQSAINSTASKANENSSKEVDLINIHTSPSKLKVPSKFEVGATVVNKSPGTLTFSAGVCDSPLSAKFLNNVVIRYTQGCTTSSPPFHLKPGDQVTIAGPSSGTIYQAFAQGQTKATAILNYQSENGHAATFTKPFEFTINP